MNSRGHDWNHERAIAVPPEHRLREAPGGGDPARFAPGGAWPPPRRGVPREFSLADAGPVLRHVARIVARHWWIGLLLAAAELTVFFIYLSTRQPVVTAEATMLAQSPLDRVLRPGEAPPVDALSRENMMRNHESLMTSRRFRAELAARFTPEEAVRIQAPFLEAGEEPSDARLRSVLAGCLSVERERGRDLFTIAATHPDEDVARMLADRFTEAYLETARGELTASNQQAQEALRAEAAELDRHILELEAQRQDFQRRFDAITGGGGREVVDARIANLNNALSVVRVQRAQAEVQLRQAEQDLKASPTPFNNPTLGAYGNTAELRAEIARKEAARAMLATHYGPKHPQLQEADREIASLKEALQNNFAVALEELRARVHLAQSEERELTRQLRELLRQAGEVDQVAAELATLDQRIQASRDAHSDLLRRIAATGISAELPVDVLRIVDHAYVRRPILPPNLVLGAAGIGGALLLFIGGPLVWQACTRRVNSALDLEMILGTELLGVVPRMPWMWAAQRPHVVRRGRRAATVDAFLAIASQFELRSAQGCPRRIVITSTLPGEGKSVVSSNLAAAFTRLGYRALLVDCDFRRPAQHRFHKCANDGGLLNWIDQGCPGGAEASLEAIGLQALPGGTWLLPTGGTDPEPARNFLLPPVAGLFERLSREFDVIIVDTSPAGLFPDPYFVTRFADVAALVVREGMASTDQVRKVIADFARTATPICGIIFNAISGGVTHPSFAYRRITAKYARHYIDGTRNLPVRTRGRPVAVEPMAG